MVQKFQCRPRTAVLQSRREGFSTGPLGIATVHRKSHQRASILGRQKLTAREKRGSRLELRKRDATTCLYSIQLPQTTTIGIGPHCLNLRPAAAEQLHHRSSSLRGNRAVLFLRAFTGANVPFLLRRDKLSPWKRERRGSPMQSPMQSPMHG